MTVSGLYTSEQLEHLRVFLYAQAIVPLSFGSFDVRVYHNNIDSSETLVFSKGDLLSPSLFLRIHSECFTGEVLGSLKCDCKFQLDSALQTIHQIGEGLVIYLRQEGRGIGLGNKIKAYALQDSQGLDTVKANHALGFASDLRNFSLATKILQELKVTSVRMNSNNPEKIKAVEEAGVTVAEIVPSLAPVNEYNLQYMHTKYEKMGHKLAPLFSSD